MINIVKIKEKILDKAISGKLIDIYQPDNFEYYTSLIKDSFLLTNKVAPISDDKIPFELPNHWKWIQIGLVGDMGMGQTILSSDLDNKGDPVYSATMSDDYFGHILPSKNKIRLSKGDIVIPARGNSIGYLKSVVEDNSTCTQTTMYVRFSKNVFKKWIYYSLLARKKDLFEHGGMAIPQITIGVIKNELIPVPPLEEQKAIVSKLDRAFAELDKIDDIQKKLMYIKQKIEAKILKLAFEGKVVQQLDCEGTGEDLFNLIKQQKLESIKKGIIKKEKPLPSIENGEVPFEIPSSWKWVRLGDLGNYKKGPFGSALTKSMFVPKSSNAIKVYEQKNAIQKDWTLGSYYIKKDYYESDMKSFTLLPGDVIVSCAGTIGETYLLPDEAEPGIINQALMRMRITKFICLDYFLLYFDTILKGTANDQGKGTAIKNIPPFDVLKSMLVPLPPLEEQKRIVKKINELLIVLS